MAEDCLDSPETASGEDGGVFSRRARNGVERRGGRQLSQRTRRSVSGGEEKERNGNDHQCSGEIGQRAVHLSFSRRGGLRIRPYSSTDCSRDLLHEYGGQSLLASPPKRIIVREPLFEIWIGEVSAVQEQPFDVHELAVAPHPHANLPLHVELILGSERQAPQGTQRAVAELARHGEHQKTSARAGGGHSVWQLESIAPDRLETKTNLLLERPELVSRQARQLR